MIKPTYCQQSEAADCWHCSLSSCGKDCQGKSIEAVQRGLKKSQAKSEAARENGKKGGRPRKQK